MRGLAASMALLAAGCGSDGRWPIGPPEDGVTVVALLDAELRLTEVRKLAPEDAALELPADGAAVAWVLTSRDLLLPDGTPASARALAEIEPVLGARLDAAASTCGCLVAPRDGPGYLHPGSACTPPPSVTPEGRRLVDGALGPLDAVTVDATAAQLRLTVPGACGFEPQSVPGFADAVDACPINPMIGRVSALVPLPALDAVATLEHIGGQSRLATSDGRQRVERPLLSDEGYVVQRMGARAVDGGVSEVVVVRATEENAAFTDLERLLVSRDGAGQLRVDRLPVQRFDGGRMTSVFSGAGGDLLLLGSQRRALIDLPLIWSCRVEQDELRCAPQELEPCEGSGRGDAEHAVEAEGRRWAVVRRGVIEEVDGGWRCVHELPASVQLGSVPLDLDRIMGFEVAGGAYVCGRAVSADAEYRVVLFAPEPAGPYTLIHGVEARDCHLFQIPGTEKVGFATDPLGLVVFEGGRALEGAAELEGLTTPVETGRSGDTLAILDERAAVHLVPSGRARIAIDEGTGVAGSVALFRRSPTEVGALHPQLGRYAFMDGDACAAPPVAEPPPSWLRAWTVDAVVQAETRLVVAGEVDGAARLQAVDPDDLSRLGDPLPLDARLRALVPLGGDTVLGLDVRGRVVAFRADAPLEVRSTGGDPGWTELHGVGGVGWLIAPEQIGRCVPRPDHVLIEAGGLDEADRSAFELPSRDGVPALRTIKLHRPDAFALFTLEQLRVPELLHRIAPWQVEWVEAERRLRIQPIGGEYQFAPSMRVVAGPQDAMVGISALGGFERLRGSIGRWPEATAAVGGLSVVAGTFGRLWTLRTR